MEKIQHYYFEFQEYSQTFSLNYHWFPWTTYDAKRNIKKNLVLKEFVKWNKEENEKIANNFLLEIFQNLENEKERNLIFEDKDSKIYEIFKNKYDEIFQKEELTLELNEENLWKNFDIFIEEMLQKFADKLLDKIPNRVAEWNLVVNTFDCLSEETKRKLDDLNQLLDKQDLQKELFGEYVKYYDNKYFWKYLKSLVNKNLLDEFSKIFSDKLSIFDVKDFGFLFDISFFPYLIDFYFKKETLERLNEINKWKIAFRFTANLHSWFGIYKWENCSWNYTDKEFASKMIIKYIIWEEEIENLRNNGFVEEQQEKIYKGKISEIVDLIVEVVVASLKSMWNLVQNIEEKDVALYFEAFINSLHKKEYWKLEHSIVGREIDLIQILKSKKVSFENLFNHDLKDFVNNKPWIEVYNNTSFRVWKITIELSWKNVLVKKVLETTELFEHIPSFRNTKNQLLLTEYIWRKFGWRNVYDFYNKTWKLKEFLQSFWKETFRWKVKDVEENFLITFETNIIVENPKTFEIFTEIFKNLNRSKWLSNFFDNLPSWQQDFEDFKELFAIVFEITSENWLELVNIPVLDYHAIKFFWKEFFEFPTFKNEFEKFKFIQSLGWNFKTTSEVLKNNGF